MKASGNHGIACDDRSRWTTPRLDDVIGGSPQESSFQLTFRRSSQGTGRITDVTARKVTRMTINGPRSAQGWPSSVESVEGSGVVHADHRRDAPGVAGTPLALVDQAS